MLNIGAAGLSFITSKLLDFGTSSLEQAFAPEQPQPEAPKLTGFAAEKAKLDSYLAARDMAFKQKYGESPPNMVAVAMPVNSNGLTPFVTAEQQRKIDSITDQFIGRDSLDGLMEALRQNGVHPYQIAANAEYFVGQGGFVYSRGGDYLAGNFVNVVI